MSIERVGPEAFRGERLLRSGEAIVSFLADWCPFCVRFVPELERLVADGFQVLDADLSAEENPLWETFHVEVVPTVVVFRDGDVVFRADGIRGVGLRQGDMSAIRGSLRGPSGRSSDERA